ncbi:MAG: FtsH protease activity modulator HflK, partial [Dehalococcoidia bacterium]|nr:FtsH protease activity modulator HflK [Dehalococcoidia bacterium]
MAKRPGGPGPVDWEASLRELGKRWGNRRPGTGGYLFLIPIVIIVIIWGLTGIYQVGPGERGVVRQFGARMAGDTGPGLHYHLPWPIQRVDVVNVESVRTAEIGFTTAGSRENQEPREVLAEALMLTGDENVVNIHAIVQYRVRDAGDYVFNIVRPDDALKSAAEVALRGVVGRNSIDYVWVEARTAVENQALEFLQALMDSYESGVVVLGVKLQEVDAPEEVRDAFQDVARAREDRERLEREAEGYAADIVPRAKGEKAKQIQEATAYKEQRVLRAQGDAERFLAVLEEYRKAPDVTRQR